MSTLYPQDFIQQIRTLFGEESDFFLQALNNPAATSIRLNPFKSSSCFENEPPIVWCEQGRYLSQRPEFIFDPLFHAGAYYVQESSSMFLHHVLSHVFSLYEKQVKVLDLCAAPGGKSTLINSLLKPSDLLVSNEIIKSRAGVLEENLMKWGQSNVVISNNDPKDFGTLKDFFDVIVVDAPCSGEGLFRRDKHAIEEWSNDNVALCEGRQQRIVADVMESLKPGGFLIYSTCTYNRKENEDNVKWMMEEWKLQSVTIPTPQEWPIAASLDKDIIAYRFLPHKVTGEGLFITCLQKPKDTEPQKGRPYKRRDKISKEQLNSVRTWLNNHDDYEFVMVGERVHAIPVPLTESFQQLTHHLYLKNAGIFMGTFAKNELIPSHHLALSNVLSQSVQRLEISRDEAIKYLRKDNLLLDTNLLGWTVLTYKQLPIGWVKLLPNRLNNYLPSHLRILKDYTYATQTEKYKEKEEKPERDYSKVKLFPNLMKAVLDCSRQIFFEKKYADKVIERMLKSNSQWGARDRAFIAEYTYDMVRWWRLLQYMSGIKENETGVKMPLMFAALWVWNGHDLPEWEEFRGFDKAKMFRLFDDAQSQRKIRESIPDWLDALGERELGPKWDAEIKALNNQADLVVRANTLKITRAGLLRKLEDEHIEASPIDDLPDAIVLHKRINLFATRFIKDGLLEVQDAASQLVADFLEVEPGMRVIDACAGAGGKSLHIAALMQNKGRLISMDIEEFKLEELKKRARRAGVGNIETRVIESSKTIKRLQETADRLLLDVPCSGLGVLRRNPDAKWKMGLDFIINIRKTQLEILQNYSIMLKPGGKMVYATCSILPSEDEEQVQTFLAANPNFELERQERISVAETGFDGFYMALISKKVSVADTE